MMGLAACGCAKPVSEVAGCCPVDLSVVSRHLAVLRDAGVLEVRKEGRTVYYAVRYAELARSLRSLADAIEACCAQETGRSQPSARRAPAGRARASHR